MKSTNLPMTDHSVHERIIADAIVDVATELRLADPIEFMAMIRAEQAANIADLVNRRASCSSNAAR